MSSFEKTAFAPAVFYPGEVDTPILDHRPNPVSDEKRAAALLPEDIAAAALMVAQMPEPRHCRRYYHFSTPGWSGDSLLSVRLCACVRISKEKIK